MTRSASRTASSSARAAGTEHYTSDFLDGVYYGPDIVPPGALYLLGDNRFDSIDSRNFGTVPVDTVVGRVVGRLLPLPGRP